MLNDEHIDTVYGAAIEATDEAIINAMVAAEPAGGGPHDRYRVEAIDTGELVRIMEKYGRLRRG